MVHPTATTEVASSVITVTTVVATEVVAPTHITLKLRRRRSRVRWAEDVVDNEDLCRKKSKRCCVFHRPRGLDESSGDESDEEKILSCFLPPSSSEAGPSSTQ